MGCTGNGLKGFLQRRSATTRHKKREDSRSLDLYTAYSIGKMKMWQSRSRHDRRLVVCVMSADVESNISRRAAGRPAGLPTECSAGAGFLANYTKRSSNLMTLTLTHPTSQRLGYFMMLQQRHNVVATWDYTAPRAGPWP